MNRDQNKAEKKYTNDFWENTKWCICATEIPKENIIG